MDDYSIGLYNNLKLSTAFISDITHYVADYQDTWRALGGCWSGQFNLRDKPLSELEEWFNYFLGCRVVRSVAGIAQWEGFISQLRLTSGGQTYVRDLNTMVNRAQIIYTSADGTTTATGAWGTNDDSLNQFGRREEIYAFDGASAAMADAYRATKLANYGWPRAIGAGGELYSESARTPPSLVVQLNGYVFTLNWRFVIANTAALTNLSAFLTALVNESEFIAPGIIATNTVQVPQRFLSSTRIWDGIERLVNLGDAGGNRYVAQVIPGRTLNYELAATVANYFIRDGALYHLDQSIVLPAEVRANRIARRTDAPSGFQNAGAFNDPRNTYVDEVDFIAPGIIRVKSEGWDLADLLEAQLAFAREQKQ